MRRLESVDQPLLNCIYIKDITYFNINRPYLKGALYQDFASARHPNIILNALSAVKFSIPELQACAFSSQANEILIGRVCVNWNFTTSCAEWSMIEHL